MIERIHERASKTTLLVATVATIFFSAIMMLVLLPQFLEVSGGLLPLDMRFTHTPAEFNNLVTALGHEGIVIYHLFHTLNMGFPIALAVTLSSAIALIDSRIFPTESRLRIAAIVPLITVFFDYSENVLIWYQLDLYPTISTDMVVVTSLSSAIKLLLFLASFVILNFWTVFYGINESKLR